jgi:aspartate/methionine/tyrosine aminotransferase
VVNGVYSLATHGGNAVEPVQSILGDVGDDIHEIWAFSKDFAMSGLRAGVLVSTDPEVLRAVAEVSHWSVVSGDTQHLLTTMLSDEEWTEHYLDEMRSRLNTSYQATTSALNAAGIPYTEAQAGMFLLVDLRQYLDEASWTGEDELWRRILDETNVNLTPGSACRVGEPGFMRICFATEPPEVVAAAIDRIGTLLAS